MTNNNLPTVPAVSDDNRKVMTRDAENARAEARIGEALAPYWDAVVAGMSKEDKRADIVRAVLTEAGLWKDQPQKFPGTSRRTPFGNVVQRFGARFDAAVKRAKEDDAPKLVNLLTRAGLNADLADVIAAWEAAHENN